MTTKENRRPSQGPEQKRRSVAVIYHFFPHYRKAVVEALARSELADFTFIGDDHEYLHSIEPAKFSDSVRFELAPTHRLVGPFMWQWGAITWAIKPEFDTVIMHSVPHWPCTWIGAILARILGKRVFFWGHGYLYEPTGLKGLIRKLFYAIPTAHMFYGERSREIAMRHGWTRSHLHVIYNSLDVEAQRRLRAEIGPDRALQVRKQLFGDTSVPVAICTTRLIRLRRIDMLISALGKLARIGHRVNLILVGDGPEMRSLRELAEKESVTVHFEGASYDERRIAELVIASTVTVAPGKVGLTAMHSMAYGVPVISHSDADDQMPEWHRRPRGQYPYMDEVAVPGSHREASLHRRDRYQLDPITPTPTNRSGGAESRHRPAAPYVITSLRSSRKRSGRDTDTKKIAPGATAIASRSSRESGMIALPLRDFFACRITP
jgi:glycosyltransferase involved in cell wall biosynthesis